MGHLSHHQPAGSAGHASTKREAGAILVMFALSLTAILLVATLVIDGPELSTG
jgi:hypothetical protein